MFANANRIALYALIVVGLLAGAIFLAVNAMRADEKPVTGVAETTVASTPDPASDSATKKAEKEKKPAEAKQKKKETKKESDKKSEDKKADKNKAEKEARERAAAREAARRAAAEQAAAERAAAERAARREAARAATPDVAPAPASNMLSMTIPKLGRYNDPVTNSVAESVLHYGAGKLPQTGFPWQPGSNTYIAAHVYGYPGTGSWQQFAGLPNMTYGDEIYLTDANGTTYTYQVSEILTVSPYDTWVTAPTGQNMVSLQTCVGPGWSQRLIVRGQLVSTA